MATNILDIIWEGKLEFLAQTEGQQNSTEHFQYLNIQSTGEIIHQEKIEQCSNEHELVSHLRPNFQWIPVPQSNIKRFQKSGELSTKLREKANAEYKIGNLKNAMRGYNLALMFAPCKSQELGIAFANRSALLVQLKQYNAALNDLENSFHFIPDNLKDKLEQRRMKCQTASCENISAEQEKESDLIKKGNEYFYKTFFKLKNPNPNIPNAENWVKIDYKEDRGRFIVATQTVPAGTLILIDKPFVNVINNLLTWDPTHCHSCSKPLIAGIPCEHCTFTIYCDETCRKTSCEGSHKYEHQYLSYLHTLSVQMMSPTSMVIAHKDLQALRILAIVGPTALRNMFDQYKKTGKLFPCSSQNDEMIPGFDSESKIYDSSSYSPMYHLISHGMSQNLRDKINDVFKSMFLTRLLKETSEFFSEIPNSNEEEKDELENFVASLLLRHLWNIKSNAMSVSKLEREEMSITFATAVYPLISLCNHSCIPNAAPVKKFKDLETALVTLKTLQPGEEICITYKPLFSTMKTKERRTYLQECYNFLCNCTACCNNWCPKSFIATDDLLLDSATIFELDNFPNCSECQMNQKQSRKDCESCVKLHLQNVAKVDDFENKLYHASDLIKKGDFMNAIEILRPCLTYFSNHFSSCYTLTQVGLELFKRALVKLANQAENFSPFL